MKKFIRFLLGLFTLIIVLLVLLDYTYTTVYQHCAPRNKFQYLFQLEPQKLDYVFLGSSRVANTIVTDEVKRITGGSAVNLGVEGAHLEDNLLQLKLLLYKKVQIGKLFLQVDYQYEDKGRSQIAISEAMPFLDNQIVVDHLKAMKDEDFMLKYRIPFYRYMMAGPKVGFREFSFSLINKAPKNDLSSGFVPKKGQVAYGEYSLPESIGENNKTIAEIKALCAKEKIELVLFCAPFCSETKNITYIKQLKERLPELRDYSSGFSDSLFYDCAHLNEGGAVNFTKKLIHDDLVLHSNL